jgi:hypothetical protein
VKSKAGRARAGAGECESRRDARNLSGSSPTRSPELTSGYLSP